ncbi:MAG TPA: pyruvate dehydrogenase (acetyl-transferring) E1 component subunit alpha, partial [Chloroflexi bacterium]|nr:pyruvate dehydrogenase (acetyl-transferring) E1 component subunit alpha [Chloroflexota bacterium]
VATYREHGHALAHGVPARAVMAEMFGRVEGCSGGRGGSMHLFSAEHRLFGGNAIVAGGLPLAVGMALADHLRREPRVTVCFFGEGAMAEGEFHECMNLAALWRLPVIFCCENNLYAMGTASEYHSAVPQMATKAAGLGITSEIIDGQDVLAMYEATQRAREYCTAGNGPYFIEAMTYRFRGHSLADPETYRDKDEIEEHRADDPISLYRERLLQAGKAAQADFDSIDAAIELVVDEAVEFADKSPWPDPSTLRDFVYADEY